MRAGILDKSLQRSLGAWSGCKQVQIADRVLTPAQASSSGDLLQPAGFRKILDQFGPNAVTEAQQKSSRALPVLRDRSQHLLFELGAHARQFAQFLLFADALQIV